MIRRFRVLTLPFLVAVLGVSTFGQVQVTLKTNQSSYLVGEPVFVVASVTNAGTEPITYSELNAHAVLTVAGGRKRSTPNFYGCFGPASGASEGGGAYDTPRMRPGQTVVRWFLLKGYDLRPGDYVLRASGDAGVRWNYVVFGSPAGPSPVPKHSASDPVDGGTFDEAMRLTVRESTEAQLRQRFAPYIADAEGWDMEKRSRAREAISEMAPAFLEKTLLRFADQPEWATHAVEGLGRIPTDDSRRDLISLFAASADLRLRGLIVQQLAEIGTPKETAFFASLLPGHSTTSDDEVRRFAALGLGRVGGSEAVRDLADAPRSPNAEVRASVAMALGNTRDSGAIQVLIRMYADEDKSVQSAACLALLTLTHLQWCYGSGNQREARWRNWRSSHPSPLKLYGADECPTWGTSLPSVD